MTDPAHTPETPLESWKEIAACLGRDARTVRRWEQTEGLPVHRHKHRARSSVYAYRRELDEWRVSRGQSATLGGQRDRHDRHDLVRWTAAGRSSVVIVPVEGGPAREIWQLEPGEWINNAAMSWTPDGRPILVRRMLKRGATDSELWIVPVSGGAPRKLDIDANRIARPVPPTRL